MLHFINQISAQCSSKGVSKYHVDKYLFLVYSKDIRTLSMQVILVSLLLNLNFLYWNLELANPDIRDTGYIFGISAVDSECVFE